MRGIPDEISNLEHVFGAPPGDDHVLVDWEPMCHWFDALAQHSPCLLSETIGESTDGREMRLLIVSAPETIENLEQIRASRTSLARDPYANVSQPVVLISAGIHATEVGGVQMMPRLVLDLVTQARYAHILHRAIVLIVPTLNPDGMALVHEWYEATRGTSAEGTAPPALYHQFAGHDNNRDWYQMRLHETRVVVENVLNAWYPHIVVDLHQMGTHAPRYVVPPYIDPVEPHVHPLIHHLGSELGSMIATAHTRAGNAGVWSGVMFDCYSPSRAYCHYHGGVRILAEAASARVANPSVLLPTEQRLWNDADPIAPSIHAPLPWTNTSWHLSDIIAYHRTTIDAVLSHVTQHSEQWLADQQSILADQAENAAAAFAIAPMMLQVDPAATRELVELLREGAVNVRIGDAEDAYHGWFIIDSRQPFGGYAEALLSHTPYPAGAQPYDITSHWLPLHMGVEVEEIVEGYDGRTRDVSEADLAPFQPARAHDIERGVWLAIDARGHAGIRLVNQALAAGADVRRLQEARQSRNRYLPAGTWIIADGSVWDTLAHAAQHQVRTWIIDPLPSGWLKVAAPRIGIYDPEHMMASDHGWLKLWCLRAGFPHDVITSHDIVHGGLDHIDTLLVPHAMPEVIANAHSFPQYPERYTHGLTDRVVSALRIWMHRGGHVISFGGAVTALAEKLHLDVVQPLSHKKRKKSFANSGAVVSVEPVIGTEVMLGINEPFPVLHIGTAGYELHDTGRQHSAARFARENLVMSGSVRGSDHLERLTAILQLPQSEGTFTAFAFRPHFRTQMLASERPLVNAIFYHHMYPGESDD